MLRINPDYDWERIYREARIARGWRFPVHGPMMRSVAIPPGMTAEDLETLLVGVCHTQALLDSRHARN